ncbi:MAG: rod shape-determining protein [Muribaculaceae bacterium]|nr:rod shape-determining protein [Muribaculaceae bacterium]
MPDRNLIVAFEIGSSRIKGAVASVDPNGALTVLAIEEEPLIDAVRYGVVRKVEEVSKRIQSIKLKLENYAAVSPGKIKRVFVSIGGRSLRSTTISVEKKFPEETEITDLVIRQLKEQALALGADNAEREVLAVIPRDFVVDNIPQKNPREIYAHSIQADICLVTGRATNTLNIKRAITERLDIEIQSPIVRQIAIGGIVLTDEEKSRGCMLVDFGAETTTVSIYRNNGLIYLAAIPIGSRTITRDLTNISGVESRAEEIKKTVGNISPDDSAQPMGSDGMDTTEINNYIRARAGEIITNIMEQPIYAGMKLSDLKGGIVVVGGGTRLRGFNAMLRSQSGLSVRQGMPSNTIRIADHRIDPSAAVDIIAVLAVAARVSKENPCVVYPEKAPQTEADNTRGGGRTEGEDETISRIGSDMDGDLSDLEDEDERPAKKKDKKKTVDQKGTKNLLSFFGDKLMRILSEESNDSDQDDND